MRGFTSDQHGLGLVVGHESQSEYGIHPQHQKRGDADKATAEGRPRGTGGGATSRRRVVPGTSVANPRTRPSASSTLIAAHEIFLELPVLTGDTGVVGNLSTPTISNSCDKSSSTSPREIGAQRDLGPLG